MKYLLIGINGVYNYGCEAIVRGSVNILRAFDPQAEITYATLSPDYDRKMLADCGLEIIPRRFISRFSFPRLARRLAACLGIEIPVMSKRRQLKKNTIMCSPSAAISIRCLPTIKNIRLP